MTRSSGFKVGMGIAVGRWREASRQQRRRQRFPWTLRDYPGIGTVDARFQSYNSGNRRGYRRTVLEALSRQCRSVVSSQHG